MVAKDLEAVVVLNQEDGHALGVVSQDDLTQAFIQRDGWSDIPTAEQVMRDGVPQVPPDIPLEAAAQIMRDQGVRALFLMHHAGGIEYPAAVLTYKHLMRLLAARDPEELADLGIQARRQSPIETFIQRRDAARESVRKAARKTSKLE
jgi:CBS domain-containing protein